MEEFYVVRKDLLPEAIVKTIEAKKLLSRREVETVHEAVKRVGVSRSVFYKYKDGVYPFEAVKERMATLLLELEHRSGVLSNVLSHTANLGGNVLMINQTIPLQGTANVFITIDSSQLKVDLFALTDALKRISGVKKAVLVGQGSPTGEIG